MIRIMREMERAYKLAAKLNDVDRQEDARRGAVHYLARFFIL